MSEYHKIDSVWKRDPATNHKTFLEGEWSRPEFGYLADNEWTYTEKVDGTNIRVILEGGEVRYGGRTDRAQIPATLLAAIDGLGLRESVPRQFDGDAVLYGEGYGPKIQKGGGLYREDQSFVLFDVRVGPFWLQRESVEEVAAALGIDCVPVIGKGSLSDAIDWARHGLTSQWGEFHAEGIVARPSVEMLDRAGRRIITKVKCRDFRP